MSRNLQIHILLYRYSLVWARLKEAIVDIPPESNSVETYSATLGHKANHNFNNNAVYKRFNLHPVLGLIMSVVAVKDIPTGGEVFSMYNYSAKDYKIAGIEFTEAQCEKVSLV